MVAFCGIGAIGGFGFGLLFKQRLQRVFRHRKHLNCAAGALHDPNRIRIFRFVGRADRGDADRKYRKKCSKAQTLGNGHRVSPRR